MTLTFKTSKQQQPQQHKLIPPTKMTQRNHSAAEFVRTALSIASLSSGDDLPEGGNGIALNKTATSSDYCQNDREIHSILKKSSGLQYNVSSSTNGPTNDHNLSKAARVSFGPKVRVRRTTSRRDYTDEEIASTWYSERELHVSSLLVCKEVDMMDAGIVLKGRKYCSRGLEGHTRVGRSIKIAARTKSFQAVFGEQDIQWDADVSEVDAEMAIAETYARTTSASQLWAVIVGFRDARDAQSCYEEEEIDEIHTSSVQSIQMSLDDDESHHEDEQNRAGDVPESYGRKEEQKGVPDSKCTAIGSDLDDDAVSVVTARAA